MLSLLAAAVFVGMHHALEPDHVAAVSSLAAGKKRWPDVVVQGLTWGLGHTATLFLIAGLALFLGKAIPDRLVTYLEAGVGIMLIALGSQVIWRIWKERIHVHTHRNASGRSHFHAHSHAGEAAGHGNSAHVHVHRFGWRTLIVGMTHGMAGSAALLVLVVSQTYSAVNGLIFIGLFGLGSMFGMALVSGAIGIPLILTAHLLTAVNRLLQACVGLVTVFIGGGIILTSLAAI